MSAFPQQSDAELLRLMLAGDEDAFTALYRRRQGGVYRFALQMSGSEALAEDVAQETFMVLMRDGGNFDPARGSVAAYLYGIARNHVLRAFDRERSLVRFDAEAEDEGEAPHERLITRQDPLGDLARGEMVEKLRRAVLALPPHYREVVVLCELHEMSYAEAAEALCCVVGTVRSRLHRARDAHGEDARASRSRSATRGRGRGGRRRRGCRGRGGEGFTNGEVFRMNCREFESGIAGPARGAHDDARERAAATAHVESCGVCAARLADERTLSAGLRALASNVKDAEAPARVESALLTAFRTRAGSVAVAGGLSNAGATGNTAPLSGHLKSRRWTWVQTVAVASLAAAASLALFVSVRQGAGLHAPSTKGTLSGTGAAARLKKLDAAPVESSPSSLSAGQVASAGGVGGAQSLSSDDSARPSSSQGVDDGTQPSPATGGGGRDKALRASFPARTTSGARALNAAFNRGGARGVGVVRPDARLATQTSVQEVATEFIPLMQGGRYVQAEGGHLVRVELPRSALASFGLPVGAEQSGGRVKADVLLGEDGIARAIRFVH